MPYEYPPVTPPVSLRFGSPTVGLDSASTTKREADSFVHPSLSPYNRQAIDIEDRPAGFGRRNDDLIDHGGQNLEVPRDGRGVRPSWSMYFSAAWRVNPDCAVTPIDCYRLPSRDRLPSSGARALLDHGLHEQQN